MTVAIPSSHMDLFQKKAFAHLACHLADGSILVNPVWVGMEGGRIVINSAEGRLKDRAIRANARITLCISDPENPYRYLEVRGRVEETTTEGADTLIDTLAKRYMGLDSYPNRTADEVRVTYRIGAEKVIAFPIVR